MPRLFLIFILCGQASVTAERLRFTVPTESPLNSGVSFEAYLPSLREPEAQRAVLFLVPGYNGEGSWFLSSEHGWTAWADREGVILLAASFRTNLEEIHSRRGYYYPDQWSGRAALDAVEELSRRTPVQKGKVFLFGFSAGAHFVHRFALWSPERVGAFVAYSAAWWDEPNERLREVPGLIMCGEEDLRLNASLAFAQKGLLMGCPWIWKSYSGIGHELTPAINEMARGFLSHYMRGEKDEPLIGDIQTFRICQSSEAENVPAICRVVLPSRKVASLWEEKP